MRWSEDQLSEFKTRSALRSVRKVSYGGQKETSSAQECVADEPESKLQARIERYLTEHGLYWFHDRSRGANRPGHPDLVVAVHAGRTLWLELKSRTGRLTKEQEQVRVMLMALGHEFHEVRSFKQFLSIIADRQEA